MYLTYPANIPTDENLKAFQILRLNFWEGGKVCHYPNQNFGMFPPLSPRSPWLTPMVLKIRYALVPPLTNEMGSQ